MHTIHFTSSLHSPPLHECHGCWHVCDGRPQGSGPGHCALVMAERHHRLPSVHPRDPFLIDSPSCTHHPASFYWGAVEECNSSTISFFYCLLNCKKKRNVHFFATAEVLMLGLLWRSVTRKGVAWRMQGGSSQWLFFFCESLTASMCWSLGAVCEKESWKLWYEFILFDS